MFKQKTSDRVSTNKDAKPDPLARFKKSRDASRALQSTKLAEGVQGIERYVEDVEGDWLETWDDNQE